MGENSRIFVDSNYFAALFNNSDSLYEKARNIGVRIINEGAILVVSNLIFLEVTTMSMKHFKRGLGRYSRNYRFNFYGDSN